MKVWRICRERYASSALSGEGSRFAAGRWNSLGVPMVYTSSSLALAALEVFVHVRTEDEPTDLVSVCAEVPVAEDALEKGRLQILRELPERWRFADIRDTRRLGDAWIASGVSLAMPVPSVVIESEWNVLLNPAHADAERIRIVETKPFRFDERMFR